MIMRIWLDDVRPAPEGYRHLFTVEEAIAEIMRYERECGWAWANYLLGNYDAERRDKFLEWYTITEISCDNDLGENTIEGYKLLDWLEATGRNYPINIHSANPVAVERMRRIIQRNGWKEIR
jgi:hypothetical protein